jgi:cytochrome b561
VPLGAVDQRFVKNLQHIALDFGEAKAADMRHDAANQLDALGIGDNPVEKIALDRAGDARPRQRFPRQEAGRIVLIHPENGERDAFGDNDQIGMLQPQRLVLHLAAIDDLEELPPKLSVQDNRRLRLELLPKPAQGGIRGAERHGIGAKFDANGLRIGRQGDFQRQRAIEPRQKFIGSIGGEDSFLDLDELALLEGKYDPSAAVRGDADEGLARLRLAIGEIIGHFALDILHFGSEIALGLEHGPPDQSIDAALDFDSLLETHVARPDADIGDKQLPKVGLDCIMVAGLAGEMLEDGERFGGGGHGARLRMATLARNARGSAIRAQLQRAHRLSSTFPRSTPLTIAPSGYRASQIALHWLVAALALFLFVTGDNTTHAYFAQPASDAGCGWVPLHAVIGLVILALMLWRLEQRRDFGVPEAPSSEAPALRWLAAAVHIGLYVDLIGAAIVGLLVFFGARGLAPLHELMTRLVLIGLVGLHVAGALWHQFYWRDNVLTRMLRPMRE